MEKEGTHLVLLSHNIRDPSSQCVYKLNTLALIGAENSVNFIGEKEKRTNKRNYKQEEADSLLHNTTSHT